MVPSLLDAFTFALTTFCFLAILTLKRSQFKTMIVLVLVAYQVAIQLSKVQLLEASYWQDLFFLRFPFLYLLIPLTTGLVISVFNRISWRHAIHLCPFAVAVWIWWEFYYLAPDIEQWKVQQGIYHGNFPLWLQWMDGIAWLVMAPFYTLGIWFWFKKHTRSNTISLTKVKFPRVFILVGMGFIGLGMVRKLGELTLPHDDIYTVKLILDVFKITYIVIAVFVLTRTYVQKLWARQQNLLWIARTQAVDTQISIGKTTETATGSKSSTSPELVLPEKEIQAITERLHHILETEELYLKAKLSLNELAEKLGVSAPHLSFVINLREQISFSSLINQYRIAWFLKMKHDPSKAHFSTLGLAMEAGFSSRSAFYAAFKKEKGTTPSKYLAQEVGSITKKTANLEPRE